MFLNVAPESITRAIRDRPRHLNDGQERHLSWGPYYKLLHNANRIWIHDKFNVHQPLRVWWCKDQPCDGSLAALGPRDRTLFPIFFTAPAGGSKTFIIKLLIEIYNRYRDNNEYCHPYITCASTGKQQ
ncbi:hypothetical protein TNCV_1894801 [Trichonephila clavipes]|nr:hypothetical protein TNCV_1894801 [Trichonephila clavipes]